MTSSLAVSAHGLGKDYLVGAPKRGVETFGERLSGAARAPLLRLRGKEPPRPRTERVTVLDDVSFDIAAGEAVGFIGHNGAGKSTLLKVLSRITAPTRGTAQIRGRTGALLEVATGFHPELTGRENVFLNGAVLGMTRAETARRFDEIVAFADVERFLETPVKRYSSGMTVRLAFAVAAHLEPDVLIVDEVLAVGDAGFQRRCLRRMAEVASEGRTVLFVSHNMSVLQSLCQRAVVLEHGRVIADAPVEQAIAAYLAGIEQLQSIDLRDRADRRGKGEVRLVSAAVLDSTGAGAPTTGQPAAVRLGLDRPMNGLSAEVRFVNDRGGVATSVTSAFPGPGDEHGAADRFECVFDELLLAPGHYRLDVTLSAALRVQDHIEGAASFDVLPGLVRGRAVPDRVPGDVLLPHRWISPP